MADKTPPAAHQTLATAGGKMFLTDLNSMSFLSVLLMIFVVRVFLRKGDSELLQHRIFFFTNRSQLLFDGCTMSADCSILRLFTSDRCVGHIDDIVTSSPQNGFTVLDACREHVLHGRSDVFLSFLDSHFEAIAWRYGFWTFLNACINIADAILSDDRHSSFTRSRSHRNSN